MNYIGDLYDRVPTLILSENLCLVTVDITFLNLQWKPHICFPNMTEVDLKEYF